MDADQTLTVYRLDPKPSRLTVQVTAGGILASFGHNPVIAVRDFTGEAQFESPALANASLHLEISASALEVTDGAHEKDRAEIEQRMHHDVLETSAYPLITFDSTQVNVTPMGTNQYRVEIAGQLTLHGLTNDQTISARVLVGPDRLRASGEFTLRQTDFGIQLVSVAGGALKVKAELKISFDITAAAAARSKDSAAA
ncbi:MAG: YceI family protein [Terriglobales bacterium]